MRLTKQEILQRVRLLQRGLDEILDAVISLETPEPEKISNSEPQQIQSNYGEWLTARELAKHFNVAPSSIYVWQTKKIIPAGTQFGARQTRWKLSEVEKYFNANSPENSEILKKKTGSRKSKILKLEDLINA